jgi:hypothetical protein
MWQVKIIRLEAPDPTERYPLTKDELEIALDQMQRDAVFAAIIGTLAAGQPRLVIGPPGMEAVR